MDAIKVFDCLPQGCSDTEFVFAEERTLDFDFGELKTETRLQSLVMMRVLNFTRRTTADGSEMMTKRCIFSITYILGGNFSVFPPQSAKLCQCQRVGKTVLLFVLTYQARPRVQERCFTTYFKWSSLYSDSTVFGTWSESSKLTT
mmetsp:Transcript_7461/g.14597  ORF Transcript_7461/g.14597 Transcript_7461/m.14597 type:complete len:145 (-) Transcript_7461:2511-2945(-)